MYIDSHAHIYSKEFDADRQFILERCLEKGVNKIFMPNVSHESIEGMLEVEEKNPGHCIPIMGLHPCNVKKNFEKDLYEVEDWLKRRKFAAIGEMGTDLYWDKTFFSQQQEAFKIQVGFAKKYQLPIVIHCRNSFRETMDLLKEIKHDSLTGIFHCFSGNAEEAQEIIDIGFYLGIGGVVTFKNGGLDKVLPGIDLKHIVLETDCPYLAPVPHRGKRNEPTYIPIIAGKVAEIKNIPVAEVAAASTANSLKVFKEIYV
ncbi:MAG TPA: TatD family hydrolase [Cytophagaceae bacterium]|jgi:TatD DNase family protein|nr:TatD family hydrolase [Cytophagaceae bacterium]